MTPTHPHTLTWHLRDWMEHRKIASYRDLAKALQDKGHPVSKAYAFRLTKTPTLLSLPLLEALCTVLECTPGDLVRTPQQPPLFKKPARPSLQLPEPAPPRLPDAERHKVVGPTLRALERHMLAAPALKERAK